MNIAELCIKRPVFATVLSIFIVLIGFVSYSRLATKLYPDIEKPAVQISCNYKGASPELMENAVVDLIEKGIVGIDGIENINSEIELGRASITIDFTLNTDLDAVINEVRAKVSALSMNLPKDMDMPMVARVSVNSKAVIYIALYSEAMDIPEITAFARKYIVKNLEVLSGVGEVQVYAGRQYRVQIEPNLDKLKLFDISVEDLASAVRVQNKNYPTGTLEGGKIVTALSMDLDLPAVKDFEHIIVKNNNGHLVKLSDVAKISLGATNKRTFSSYNGKNSIIIAVDKQPNANPTDISSAVKAQLKQLSKDFPEELKVKVAFDTARFIEASIDAIYHTIFEAIILVVLVIILFIQSVRSSFIPIITIPISLIGTFAMMKFFGFSINSFTLLALILAIGLVVDDAIVMMENIFRYVEKGEDKYKAALLGSKEIMFAVIAMSLTLFAVFLPVGFMDDFIGKFFNEFAWTLAFSVLISGFVSLTLTPMMSSLLLRKEESKNRFFILCEQQIENVKDKYHFWLGKVLDHRKYMYIVLAGALVSSVIVLNFTKQELLPLEDRGFVFIPSISPEGVSFDYTKKYLKQVGDLVAVTPDVTNFFSFIYKGGAITFVDLKDWGNRKRSQMEIANELNTKLPAITGLASFALNLPSLDTGNDDPIVIILKGYVDYSTLDKVADKIIDDLRSKQIFFNVKKDIKLNSPTFKLIVNRDKAAYYNVAIDKIAAAIAASSIDIDIDNSFRYQGELYGVNIALDDRDKADASLLEKIYVKNKVGKPISLLSLVDYQETVQPKLLFHHNKLRSVSITASQYPGIPLGSIVEMIKGLVDKDIENTGISYEFSGQIKDLISTSASLYITFIMAIIFIYLVLAAQFESFVDAAIIICSVPFAIFGALLTLFIIGGSLNIYSKIGLITLVGLIAKNAILIVEFTNHKILAGSSIRDAVVDASVTRLRPILMTTIATIVGAVPLALASGPGSESRNEIGWVIVGGLFIGTLFTLFVIPLICLFVKSMTYKKNK